MKIAQENIKRIQQAEIRKLIDGDVDKLKNQESRKMGLHSDMFDSEKGVIKWGVFQESIEFPDEWAVLEMVGEGNEGQTFRARNDVSQKIKEARRAANEARDKNEQQKQRSGEDEDELNELLLEFESSEPEELSENDEDEDDDDDDDSGPKVKPKSGWQVKREQDLIQKYGTTDKKMIEKQLKNRGADADADAESAEARLQVLLLKRPQLPPGEQKLRDSRQQALDIVRKFTRQRQTAMLKVSREEKTEGLFKKDDSRQAAFDYERIEKMRKEALEEKRRIFREKRMNRVRGREFDSSSSSTDEDADEDEEDEEDDEDASSEETTASARLRKQQMKEELGSEYTSDEEKHELLLEQKQGRNLRNQRKDDLSHWNKIFVDQLHALDQLEDPDAEYAIKALKPPDRCRVTEDAKNIETGSLSIQEFNRELNDIIAAHTSAFTQIGGGYAKVGLLPLIRTEIFDYRLPSAPELTQIVVTVYEWTRQNDLETALNRARQVEQGCFSKELLITTLSRVVRLMTVLQQEKCPHGNIHPRNLLLNEDGTVLYLADFLTHTQRIARWFAACRGLRGSKPYWPPEVTNLVNQFRNLDGFSSTSTNPDRGLKPRIALLSKVRQLNPYKADVFSFGLILLEATLLTTPILFGSAPDILGGGKKLADNEDSARISRRLKRLVKSDIFPLSYCNTLSAMLEFNPNDRPDWISLSAALAANKSIFGGITTTLQQAGTDLLGEEIAGKTTVISESRFKYTTEEKRVKLKKMQQRRIRILNGLPAEEEHEESSDSLPPPEDNEPPPIVDVLPEFLGGPKKVDENEAKQSQDCRMM